MDGPSRSGGGRAVTTRPYWMRTLPLLHHRLLPGRDHLVDDVERTLKCLAEIVGVLFERVLRVGHLEVEWAGEDVHPRARQRQTEESDAVSRQVRAEVVRHFRELPSPVDLDHVDDAV